MEGVGLVVGFEEVEGRGGGGGGGWLPVWGLCVLIYK